MDLFPPIDSTLLGTLDALCSGRTTCRRVLEACLARIDECESEIHAWVVVDRDGARAEADRIDAELETGRPMRPLTGIPIGVKDIMNVRGQPTEFGVPGWLGLASEEAPEDRARCAPEHDAVVVADLRARGTLILGKSVSTPYAWIDPPPTRNPWNLDRTPGGSSSGPAAAVASGMCLGALGSQTGGSITRPASYCGVAGFKPTFGSRSTEGILPLSRSLDHPGPIARTVADLALLADVAIADPGEKPLTIGRLHDWFDPRTEPTMLDAMSRATAILSAAGLRVTEVPLPGLFAEFPSNHYTIMSLEASTFHRRDLEKNPARYPARIRTLIEDGQRVTGAEYWLALSFQDRFRTEMVALLSEVDVLLTPAALGPAPDTSTTGDPSFNSPWSLAGFPTITHPIGLSPDGLPLGLQLIGRPGPEGEASLFAAALRTEAAIRSAAGAPELPPL